MNGEILWNLVMVLYDHWIHSMFGFDVCDHATNDQLPT